jgi:uncharacterized protein (DUF849 family)
MAVVPARAAELYLEAWHPILRVRPDVLLYPTVGFGGSIEERYAHVALLAEAGVLRVGLVDPGSVNLGDFVYVNSTTDIAHEVGLCAQHRLGPSVSIFEPGFLRAALALHRDGHLPAGALIKPGLDAYLEMLDGSGLPWSVAVVGGDLVASGLARLALERGGHLRVGLEDHAGARTPTNEELVREAAALVREVGRPVASCAEAAELLGVPASAQV